MANETTPQPPTAAPGSRPVLAGSKTALPGKSKRKFSPGSLLHFFKGENGWHQKRLIIFFAIIIVLTAGIFWLVQGKSQPANAENLTEYTVGYGNVEVTVEGPGTVQPLKTYTIATNMTGDILEDYFKEGDVVAKDAVLYQLDESTVNINIDDNKKSVTNAQKDYQDSLGDLSDLTLYAETGGTVSELSVKKGEQVQDGAKIADLVDTSRLTLTVPFNTADAQNIKTGQSATITLTDFNTTHSGTVKKIYSGQTVSGSNAVVTNIEIVFNNPGAVTPGVKGTALVGNYACNDEGEISYTNETTVYAKNSGRITELNISQGEQVKAGQKLLKLENDNITDAVDKAKDTLNDATEKLSDNYETLQITSPIEGTVISKTAKAGDTLTTDSSQLCTVADMTKLTFTIEVDELEIKYVKEGQTATVTADAYEDQSYEGLVTNVSKTGTTNNGVTTYPVTIEIEEYGDLLPGMNVDAVIVADQAENVLTVPTDAITRGNMILVKDGSASQTKTSGKQPSTVPQAEDNADLSGNQAETSGQLATAGSNADGTQQKTTGFMNAQAPNGYSYRQVETGLSNDDLVEIISGLAAGDVIAYTPASSSGGSSGMMMEFSGGMGGAPSGGGMGGGPR